MGRAPCCDKANVKRGPWSPEEDAKLKSHIEQHGTGGNWISLPQKIGLKRCGKSCRLRWLNYLRPNIKHGGFSEEEDNIICSLYINIGSRWSVIASQLPGRTDNDIKNYWNTRLKKKLLNNQSKDQPQNRQPSGVLKPETKKKEINGSAMDAINNNGAGHSPYCLQTPAPVSDDDQASVMRLVVKLQEKLAGHEAAAADSNGTCTPFMASESASPQTLYDDSASLLSNKHSTELDDMFSFSSDKLEELDCFHDIVIGAMVDEGCGPAVASESMNWNEQMIPLVNPGTTSMLQTYHGVQYNSVQLQPHVRNA